MDRLILNCSFVSRCGFCAITSSSQPRLCTVGIQQIVEESTGRPREKHNSDGKLIAGRLCIGVDEDGVELVQI